MSEQAQNPFTQHLLAGIRDETVIGFVVRWDALESLIVEIFRNGSADRRARRAYHRLREELYPAYNRLRQSLAPHWQTAEEDDDPVEADPFLQLLTHETAAAFVENWEAMRTLPEAREAINSYLIAMQASD